MVKGMIVISTERGTNDGKSRNYGIPPCTSFGTMDLL